MLSRLIPAELNTWKVKFATNIRSHPTARKAWQEIERARIASEAAFLLFQYVSGNFAVEELADRSRNAVEAMRTAQRAIREAKHRQRDPRKAMFTKRALKKIINAAFHPYDHHRTLADLWTALGRPRLDKWPDALAKYSESVRRSGTITVLRTLQLHAGKHGVRLGLKRLLALLDCASDKHSQHEQNLSRSFNRPDMKRNDSMLLADFEHYLSPSFRQHLQKLFTIAPLLSTSRK